MISLDHAKFRQNEQRSSEVDPGARPEKNQTEEKDILY